MALTNITRRRAVFFDDRGEYDGMKYFKRSDKNFDYKDGTYNTNLKASFIKLSNGLYKTNLYVYRVGFPDPEFLRKIGNPVITPKIYQIMMKTKLAERLNAVNKGFWFNLLQPKFIIIALIIIGIVYYFASGGSIT